MVRIGLALALLAALAACGGAQNDPLSLDQQAAVAYRAEGPPKLTIITMVNNRTGNGGHTALMVSGSQRVIFDPAGSFRPDWVTEYGDVLYGITPRYFQAYRSAHARISFHVVTQEIEVSPAVAEQALALVERQGTVPGAFCTNATTSILSKLPGFEDIRVTFYPVNLQEQIAARGDVVTDKYFENDAGDVLDGFSDLPPLE